MSYLMEIDNLGKRYDDFELSGVSLAVEPGCVVGFILEECWSVLHRAHD